MKTRTELINFFAKKYNYKSYLEIGVFRKDNFNVVQCEKKICVDPDPKSNADFIMLSDDFFKNNKERFDLIFIDGLHHREQVYRDITNSLNFLNDNGTIICHDMLPATEKEQLVPVTPENANSWTGDCWKAWFQVMMNDGLETCIVDIDHGVGVIRKNKDKKSLINWNFFLKFKQEMNIISENEFIKKFE